MLKISLLGAVLVVAVGIYLTWQLYQAPDLPEVDLQRWWGKGKKLSDEDIAIRPFKITFNDTMIADLRDAIKKRRPFTKSLEGIQSQYGMNPDYLTEVLNYWVDGYDFKSRAGVLNQFEHFKTKIQGLDIHYVRKKPEGKDLQVLPLLMLHGWPSSSKEFMKTIPMLSTPRPGYDFVFEVIAADLPGFGYSEGTNKQGFNTVQIGIIMRNLMHRLGHKKFYIHAGDWGAQTATHMATLFPGEVLGLHATMLVSSRPVSQLKLLLGAIYPPLIVDSEFANRIYPLSKLFEFFMRESGYFHILATKPDTIGVALTDSPSGLASFVLEKMAVVTNRDQLDTRHGGLEALERDDVIDTLTILWDTNCIVTSSRIYAESSVRSGELVMLHNIPTPVPTAALNFKHEVMYHPDSVLRDKFPNLVHSTTYNFGGHYAAMQTPKEVADDVFAATKEFLKFHLKNEPLDV